MKKIVIRYGMYGLVTLTIISGISYVVFKDNPKWEVQEIIGYASIVLSLSFVYFGIRHWRDKYNGGVLGFGKGLGLGTLISVFPSMAFGLFSWIQLTYLDPGFSDRYYNDYVEKIKKTTSPENLDAALKKLAEEKEMFSSPFAQFFLMFITVFVIGIIITIISTLILRRNKQAE